MIKYFCDICGEELDDDYGCVEIREYTVNVENSEIEHTIQACDKCSREIEYHIQKLCKYKQQQKHL